ncbi:MAG TPA: glycosyl hydrolase 115 family protein [Chryseosolibacter sp.]|nr:glycosyl hydrolase 115 family protein [Chryseosolibacter sp.]
MILKVCQRLLVVVQCTLIPSALVAQEKGPFVIASPQASSALAVNENEEQVVHIAAGLFAADVYDITGISLPLRSADTDSYEIKVGTLGVSSLFDQECKKAGIDIDKLVSAWEAFAVKTVIDPVGKNVLLIAGSNARGTAYGLMELSRRIGVSPWRWWADVTPGKKRSIELPVDLFIQEGPKVKYRGIFLNDEDWGLQPWAAKTFEPETGDIGPKTYAKIFELLLRLKANTIWPAMHPSTKAFYTIPGNKEMAAKYQIFIGTSHAEPMLRNNVGEWDRKTFGEFDYSTNREVVKNYWQKRIEALAPEDKYIVTLGMRGIHDSGMQGNFTPEQKVEMLETIISDQRKMLTNVLKKNITDIPQAFIPYKEVLEIYSDGARIPEDVTLVWADDNHGYIRQVSNMEERKRSGGAGVYYHISYWGRPHDFLWIESIPVSLIWQEMHKAYVTGAKDIWIANVGDIKPIEVGMNFFLDMAWNPDQFTPDNLMSYYTRFAAEQFGNAHAKEIGETLAQYFQLGFSRKPEHMGWTGVYPNTPIQDPELSLFTNGDEVQQRIDAYTRLEQQVTILQKKLPENLKDAFYQLVGYKVLAASNMNKKLLYAYKSRVYAGQGRVSANLYAEKAARAFERIKEITDDYNRQNNGKWAHMMSFNPRRLPVYGMPEVGHVEPVKKTGGGVIPEGAAQPVQPGRVASLPVFLSCTARRYFIDVFNAGQEPVKWSAKPKDPWIQLSSTSGETATEERVWASVDWSLISGNKPRTSSITITVGNSTYDVHVRAERSDLPLGKQLFVEENGVVAIEAEHGLELQNTTDREWKKVQGLGRENDAVGAFPLNASPIDPSTEGGPALQYEFVTRTVGEATLRFYCLPSQPINGDYRLRFAVSIDGGAPVTVDAALKEVMDEYNMEWQTNVLRAANIKQVKLTITQAGTHLLKITMIDPGVVLDKIEVVLNQGEKLNSYFGSPETKVNTQQPN